MQKITLTELKNITLTYHEGILLKFWGYRKPYFIFKCYDFYESDLKETIKMNPYELNMILNIQLPNLEENETYEIDV